MTAIESDDDEEVNAIETVQEVVEVTVDSGAAKSVWPSRKKGVERTKSKKAVKLAAANGSPIRVEGDARLEFIRDGMKCSMKFLDADVKRPLASVSAIVDEGNVVVFGQHESFIENVSTGQRIPMCRRNGVFVMQLDTQPCQKTTKSVRFNEEGVMKRMDVGFHEAGVTNNAEEIRERCKTETNIEMRRQGGMAKIDGVDEGGEVEGAGGREESDEWEEFGNRKVVRKHDPRQPSQQEKEEHEMTHLPFRSWCRHCIMERGRDEDCRKSMEEERQVPEVHLDYMFMGDEKEGKTLAFLVARERETRAVLSSVVPRKTTGEGICRRLMAWLREIGLESVDIIVKSDNEPALTSLIASWSTMRAMTSGSRDDHREQSNWQFKEEWNCREGDPVGAGDDQDDSQRHRRTVGSVKIDATHSIWPWIAEHAGFLLTRFEVGRDGKTAYERLKGKSAKVQGMAFAEGILWKRKRAGGPLTCMWEDGVYVGVKATTAEVIVGNRNGVWLTRTVRRKPAKERWDRSNLEMVVAVPWRKNEDDPKMDGERLKSEVIVMDEEYKEKLEAEEHVRVPKRVYISRENLEEFGFTARCPGSMSLLRGTARQAHTES